MWKFSRYFAVWIIFFPVFTCAQDCDFNIYGTITDLNTGDPVSYASIYVKELQTGDVSDSLGGFHLTSVCAGEYHISFSHIGCETQEQFFTISGDTTLTIFLDHNSHLMHEVAITEKSGKVTTQEIQSLNSESIAQHAEKNLANMLENISGVSVVKNGSGIAKPVVHGLYGNRLVILNNGIAQSGQQWGVDHSPEIDPLVANRITVIKGVGALEYPGNSLGSVILVEPKKIDKDPHLHGEGRYFFESNGRGNGLNFELQQHTKTIGWRAIATLKKSGDRRTSKYFLRNTGNQEVNVALQFKKNWNKKWVSNLYLSSFNAEFGVLRGSHIGNLTDLEGALEREIPFYTEDEFSYSINSPSQKVNHHLLKFKNKYSINDKQWIAITYAGQYNLRKEFDVRRSGRSEIPALSLEQFSNFLEAKYQNYIHGGWMIKGGFQVNRTDNANLPETGILPLIPDYVSQEYGLFAIGTKTIDKTTIEFGGRYDYELRNVASISITVPREIIRYQNEYYNGSLVGGITQEFNDGWKVAANIGYTSRNPEVNELYSNGLHQGVSGIEEGDPLLREESSIKSTFSINGDVKNRLFFEGLCYHQNIYDYIFLNPQDEIRLTIRGAFPVFKYEQADARLVGFDIASTYKASERVNLTGKYSFLDGYDRENKRPLVFMPSNNLYAALNYQIPNIGKFQNVEIQFNNRYVFAQKNLLSSQDFVSPPDAYNLVGMQISSEKQLRKLRVKMFMGIENLLNTTYRDYLNRQRYFADDLGINFKVGVNVSI